MHTLKKVGAVAVIAEVASKHFGALLLMDKNDSKFDSCSFISMAPKGLLQTSPGKFMKIIGF